MSETITIPWSEFKPDQGVRTGDGMALVQGAVPAPGGYGPGPKFTGLSNSYGLANFTQHLHVVPHEAAPAFSGGIKVPYVIYVFTSAGTIYGINPTTDPWTTFTLKSGLSFDNWYTCQYGVYTIICRGHGHTVLLTDSLMRDQAYATVPDLITSTAKPRARFAAPLGHQLVLANLANITSEDPNNAGKTVDENMVWFSEFDDPRKFTTSNSSGTLLLYDDMGPITGIAGGKEWGVIFKARGLYRMETSPGPFPVRVTPIPQGIGTWYPKSVIAVNDRVWFFGPNGPAVFDGSVVHDLGFGKASRAITDVAIQSDIRGSTSVSDGWNLPQIKDDANAHLRVVVGYNAADQTIHWFYSRDEDNPVPYNHVISYSIPEDRFAFTRFALTVDPSEASAVSRRIRAVASIPPSSQNWGSYRDIIFSIADSSPSSEKIYGTSQETGASSEEVWNTGGVRFRIPLRPHASGLPWSIVAFRPRVESTVSDASPERMRVRIRSAARESGASPEDAGTSALVVDELIELASHISDFSGHARDGDGWIHLATVCPFAPYNSFELSYETRDTSEEAWDPNQVHRLYRGVDLLVDTGAAGAI